MARGIHPHYLFSNPNVQKSLEDIYVDLDGFTDEVFEENTARFSEFSAFFLLPPLIYRNKFVKGILFTHAADLLLDRYPFLTELFNVVAYAMWSGVPRCARADAIMMCYDNKHREAWYKARNPDRAHQVWIPHDDTDFFNECIMAPSLDQKDIDVLYVARLDAIKNLDVFAESLKIMHRKTGRRMRAMLHTGSQIDTNWTGLHENQKAELRKINAQLGNTPDYLTINTQRMDSLKPLYNRSRVAVMLALCEGKNRSIHEAMSCDTPVITFEHFNQYSRGGLHSGIEAFPKTAGLKAPEFTAESLADTILQVILNPEKFTPRESVLKVSGRKTVFNAVIDRLPYYRETLPGFEAGRHHENAWIDGAMRQVYGQGVYQYIYQLNDNAGKPRVWHKGMEDVDRVLRIYEKLLPVINGLQKQAAAKAAEVANAAEAVKSA